MTGNSSRRARDRGSSAVEFSLVVAAMAAMILAVVFGIGGVLGSALQDPCQRMSEQLGGGGACSAAP